MIGYCKVREKCLRKNREVQSLANLTQKRKMQRRKKVSGGDGRRGGTSTLSENDEVAMVKSESLVGLLEVNQGAQA